MTSFRVVSKVKKKDVNKLHDENLKYYITPLKNMHVLMNIIIQQHIFVYIIQQALKNISQ